MEVVTVIALLLVCDDDDDDDDDFVDDEDDDPRIPDFPIKMSFAWSRVSSDTPLRFD